VGAALDEVYVSTVTADRIDINALKSIHGCVFFGNVNIPKTVHRDVKVIVADMDW
jgi:hypothetical protein